MYFTMQNALDTAVLTWPDIFTTETFELLKSEKTEVKAAEGRNQRLNGKKSPITMATTAESVG